METLKEKLFNKIQPKRDEVKDLVKKYGDTKVGEIKLRQLYSGMRGMLSMITETSKEVLSIFQIVIQKHYLLPLRKVWTLKKVM